ncbi:MAG: BON domain-containing protein [Xanthobacteraceae bacterium]|nr:BON domain-containing protein [Xanthobacteraceae bacterium]
MRALAAVGREVPAPAMTDAAIRKQLLGEFEKQPWVPVALIDATVKDGVVELWGTILEGSQGEAIRVLAENVPGVKKVASHLTWVDPVSGMVISDADNASPPPAATPSPL